MPIWNKRERGLKMSELNSNSGYLTESDKCPNCGAMKVFSALVCPACGMSYAEAAEIKKNEAPKKIHFYKEDAAEAEKKPVSMNDFDPNAALAEFKNSLEPKDTEGEDQKDGVIVEEQAGKKEEAGAGEAPVRADESPLNSGLYKKERKYIFEDEAEKTAPVMSEKRPEPEPDKTIVPTRYGLDAKAVQEKREQSLSDDARTSKMFSNTVNNHYEQYRSDRESSYSQQTYATPYNRGSFDAAPIEKPKTWKKVLPLAIVLIVVLIIGYFLYKYIGL